MLEGFELRAPQRLGLFEPVLQRRNRFRVERVNAHPRIECRMALRHKTAFAQLPEVTAHGGQSKTRALRQLARAMGPFAQELDHSSAMRIGERSERAIDAGGTLAHTQPSILSPLAASACSRDTCRTVCPNDQT